MSSCSRQDDGWDMEPGEHDAAMLFDAETGLSAGWGVFDDEDDENENESTTVVPLSWQVGSSAEDTDDDSLQTSSTALRKSINASEDLEAQEIAGTQRCYCCTNASGPRQCFAVTWQPGASIA
jgi:outer membrane protease